MRITMRQVEAAYEVASQVGKEKMTVEEGARSLSETVALNVNSARDFIRDYRDMLRGKGFQRAMSAPNMDYFLTRMVQEHGEAVLARALSAVRKHISYYEGVSNVTLHAMRKVVDRHQSGMADVVSLESHEKAFNAAVENSLTDSSAKRRARLARAATIPVRVKAVTFVYQRNADVVAEVIHRAAGKCERCKRPAPFRKQRDGTPYLEVHHKIRLARNGEDTVENATALCPNCHRELHFGKADTNR